MKSKIYNILFLVLFVFSCNEGTERKKILSENTGKQEEVILVIEDFYWEGNIGEVLRNTFEKEIEGLPQSEHFFNLIQINNSEFSRFFRTHKNIIFVGDDFKDSYTKNKWAKAQIVMYIDSKSEEETFLKSCIKAFNFLNRKELENIKYTYQKGHNTKARKHIKDNFGIEIFLPTEYSVSLKEEHLFISDFHSFNENQDLLKYVLVYDFIPEQENIQKEIIQYTDSILKHYIKGAVEGSFVQLDNRITLKENDGLCRGMWTLKNGFMAGPFVMRTRYIDDRIVISLGLVFYPNESKRNYVRTFESLL